MKQLIQNMKTGVSEIKEIPIPKPGKGTALVRTGYSLVSAGTERTLVEFSEKNLVGKAASRPDLVRQVLDKAKREGVISTVQSAFNRLDQPMFPGYSSAGTIVALGEGMTGFHVGDRVACGGGNHAVHAEYEVVPRNLLTLLPDSVPSDEAAFATLGSVAMHGFRLASPQLNDTVLVIGLGLVGLMEVQIAKAAGCRVLGTDVSAGKVGLAGHFGIEACLTDAVRERASVFTRGRGFDHVLICAGSKTNETVELAGLLCRDRGDVIAIGAVGLDIPRKIYYEKELRFMVSRSYGPGRYDAQYEEKGVDYPIGFVRWTEGRNMEAFIDLIAEGKMNVRDLITHRIPIEEGETAYELITGKLNEPFLGVLLQYPDEPVPAEGQAVPLRESSAAPVRGKVRVGVLGAGNYANATFLPVMKASADTAELVSIASGSGGKARHSGEKFGFEKAEANGTAVLTDPSLDAVVLLTPHRVHAAQVISGLENHKSVYCEKPLALDMASLASVYRKALETPDHFVTVGYNRRFAPLSQTLKAAFADSAEPLMMHYSFNAAYIPLTHWTQDPEIGGGRILGEACHAMDYLIFLSGSLPLSVNALALPNLGKYNDDNVSIQVRFANGSIGVIDYYANGDKSFPKETFRVSAGGRIAELNDYRSLEVRNNGNGKKYNSPLKQDKGHAGSWNAFLKAVKDGVPCLIPYEELFSGMMACFAAVESIRQQEPVAVPTLAELKDYTE